MLLIATLCLFFRRTKPGEKAVRVLPASSPAAATFGRALVPPVDPGDLVTPVSTRTAAPPVGRQTRMDAPTENAAAADARERMQREQALNEEETLRLSAAVHRYDQPPLHSPHPVPGLVQQPLAAAVGVHDGLGVHPDATAASRWLQAHGHAHRAMLTSRAVSAVSLKKPSRPAPLPPPGTRQSLSRERSSQSCVLSGLNEMPAWGTGGGDASDRAMVASLAAARMRSMGASNPGRLAPSLAPQRSGLAPKPNQRMPPPGEVAGSSAAGYPAMQDDMDEEAAMPWEERSEQRPGSGGKVKVRSVMQSTLEDSPLLVGPHGGGGVRVRALDLLEMDL